MLKKAVILILSFFNIFLLKAAGWFTRKTLVQLTPKSNESVLILAPHADDEVLGCGVILKKHADNFSNVNLVMMTDGSGSMSNMERKNLKETRKTELAATGAALGINEIIHLNFPDGGLIPDEAGIHNVAEIINQKKPDIIYVPFFCDFHKDHVAANQILSRALRRTSHYCEIRAYEVQVPITPSIFNAYFEISDYRDYKINLMKQYESQTLSLKCIMLNWDINAAFIKNARSVEVFFVTDSQTYGSLVESFVKNRQEWVRSFYATGNSAKILLTYLKGRRIRKKILAGIFVPNPHKPLSALKRLIYIRKTQ